MIRETPGSKDLRPFQARVYRAVIFDMDGTLLDTIGDIADSMNAALEQMGFPGHPMGRYLDFVGEGMEVLVRKALPDAHRTTETMAAAVASMRAEYSVRWSCTSKAFDGVAEMLDGLAARGVRMSILSNKLDAFAKVMAEALLPRWRFFEVRGLTPECPKKPDPAGALLCAGSMDVSPAKCIFVGDSTIDMETAVRAGMEPCGVLWGYQDRQRLLAGGAHLLMDNPRDLLGYFPG
ncbi:MAG TPA: HAD family hydrolase [Deltaproteobacteria bacterium]|nr:HAD family hydrolase [Deltaproteobacteria bacterium]